MAKVLQDMENEEVCREVLEEELEEIQYPGKRCTVCGKMFFGIRNVCGDACHLAFQMRAREYSMSSPIRLAWLGWTNK